MKKFIKTVGPHARLYRDSESGIAWIEDGSTGLAYSAHSNIDETGSVTGMKSLGRWRKQDRTVNCHGFIYNIDTFAVDPNNSYEVIAANECMCAACIERRDEEGGDRLSE